MRPQRHCTYPSSRRTWARTDTRLQSAVCACTCTPLRRMPSEAAGELRGIKVRFLKHLPGKVKGKAANAGQSLPACFSGCRDLKSKSDEKKFQLTLINLHAVFPPQNRPVKAAFWTPDRLCDASSTVIGGSLWVWGK